MKLAFSSAVVVDVTDFDHAIAQIKDTELLGATGIVLRVHSQLWLDLTSNFEGMSRELNLQGSAVAARAPGIDVFALPDGHSAAEARPPYTARHSPRLLFGKTSNELLFLKPLSDELVANIREQDLHRIVDAARSRCVICAAANHHFALPSGAHASQFLRLAEAFLDMEAVDRIAYWVALDICSKLPPFPEDKPIALVVDHPSMLILGARVQKLIGPPLSVFSFPTYPSDMEARTATFRLLDRVASAHSNVFVLIGVASTGRLGKTISAWSKEKNASPLSTSILYALQPVEGQSILCDLTLPDYVHRVPGESCPLCEKGSEPIDIQASSYMIGYGPSKAISLDPKFFDSQKPFFQKWGGVEGALRVHFDDPNEATARHHAFYINVGTLLDRADFFAEVLDHIASFQPTLDAIVIPNHPTANRLGRMLHEALRIPLVILDGGLLAGDRQDAALSTATALLVVDDMFISGSRFDAINRFLRERFSTHLPAVKAVHFFSVLATPPSNRQYATRVQGLTRNHGWEAKVSHLYRFLLPNWHSPDDCPWCNEQKTLSRLAQAAGGLDDSLSERLAALGAGTSAPMSDPYFLVDPRIELPGLGAQSRLMEEGASPLQVLFTCASAFQQLRHSEDGDALSASLFPTPTFVADRTFSSNYSERVIWLGLLRALKSVEFDQGLKKFLRAAALDGTDHQRSFVHAELAIAWLTGKLGPIDATPAVAEFFGELDIPWAALLSNGFVDAWPPGAELASGEPQNGQPTGPIEDNSEPVSD